MTTETPDYRRLIREHLFRALIVVPEGPNLGMDRADAAMAVIEPLIAEGEGRHCEGLCTENYCAFCRALRVAAGLDKQWTCQCGYMNTGQICTKCGRVVVGLEVQK